MIEQTAIVTDVSSHLATVQVVRESTCGQCQSQKVCGTQTLSKVLGKRFSSVQALNRINAQIGDVVVIGLRERVLLKSAFLVYIFPLVLLFAGALCAKLLVSGSRMEQLVVVFAGLAGFAYGFYRIRKLMHVRAKDDDYTPVILNKVSATQSELLRQSRFVEFDKG